MKTIRVTKNQTREVVELMMSVDKITSQMVDLPIVFFIRSTDGKIPIPTKANSSLESNSLENYLEFNYMNTDVLSGIANLMHHVYLPAVQKIKIVDGNGVSTGINAPTSTTSSTIGHDNDIDEGLLHELDSNMTKFEQQLRHVVQQVRGDVRLTIPSVQILSPESAALDYEIVSQLEAALEDWMLVVQNAVDTEHQKQPKAHRTPLGEIEFWRERNASLSALYEQINMPRVQQMLQVLRLLENPQLPTFHYHFGELSKLYLEAKDNVKFLSTLERHFKHIAEGSFSTILDTLPSMVNGLRMVWVISRHYNTDERMAPLMENIAETLARRIREEVKLSEILLMENMAATQLIREAKEVLEQWSENYFRMRKRIEDSGSDHRWEFDRKSLFGKTDYMAEICSNFLEIMGSLDRFHKFLGPELKAVTGDSAGIDEVLKRVEGLTQPLKVPFEDKIFDKLCEKPWETIMKRFRANVQDIDKMTEQFIKESFRKLRSAEGAFDLVQSFQNIGGNSNSNNSNSNNNNNGNSNGSGGNGGGGGGNNINSTDQQSMKQQISDRYKDILEQYIRELDAIHQTFNSFKDHPPLYKNYPPVAGAIAWARDLYLRAKRPILRFKKHGLLSDDFGENVKERYLIFARSVDHYISDLYNDWEGNVATLAVEKLRQPVLKSIAIINNNNNSNNNNGYGLTSKSNKFCALTNIALVL